VALRAALGASRSRLFTQFLTESLVLAIIGGALGVFVAQAIVKGIEAVMPPVGTMLPSEANIRISIPVLLFTIGVSTLAGLLFGAAPAWQATRFDLNEVLKQGTRTGSGGARRNALRALIVAEFALALTLLASGGLALRGFWNLTRIDLGISPDRILTFRLPVPDKRLDGADKIRAYYQQMLEHIKAVPGVTKVAATTGVPARGPNFGVRINIVGQPPVTNPAERPGAGIQMVTPDYVDTLGIKLVKGRNLNEQDTATSTRVAIVNEFFAKRFFPNADPIEQRILADELIPGKPRGQQVEWQIVGVFHDTRAANAREDYAEIYVPFAQSPWPQASMVVKTEGDPKSAIRSIETAVNSVDPDLPLAGVLTIDELLDDAFAIDRFTVVLFSFFGVLGLLLAAVGIYGVMAFGVGQRTHEFGIRMALGAQRSGVINLVLKEGTILAICGSAIGLIGAYFVGRAMQSTLYEVGAFDVRAFGAVALLLLVTALVACLVPAWRASRVEPLEALRYE
jgi:putative ABC transport system permease protein